MSRRRAGRWPVLVTVVVIGAITVAVIWAALRSSSTSAGPLRGPVTSATSIPVKRLSQVATIGDAALRNTGQTMVVLRSVAPVDLDPGLHVTVGVTAFSRHSVGGIQGMPPGLHIHPVAGYHIPPSDGTAGVEFVAVLRITGGKPGTYRVGGFNVTYTAGGNTHTLFLAEAMGACYPFSSNCSVKMPASS